PVDLQPVGGRRGPGDLHLRGQPGDRDRALGRGRGDSVVASRAVDAHDVVLHAVGDAEVEEAEIDQVHARAGQVVDHDAVRSAEGEERKVLVPARVEVRVVHVAGDAEPGAGGREGHRLVGGGPADRECVPPGAALDPVVAVAGLPAGDVVVG